MLTSNLRLYLKATLQETIRNDDFQRNTALQHCFEWFQHCSNIATLCCAKNRRCESSRVTLPLNTALIYKKTSHADVVSSYRAGFLFILLLTPLQKSISLIFFPTISKVCSSPLQDQSKNQQFLNSLLRPELKSIVS